MSKESPACCTMSPCVTCSLLASCITEGLDIPVRIDRCIPLKNEDTVRQYVPSFRKRVNQGV
jgi:hypothetical protein